MAGSLVYSETQGMSDVKRMDLRDLVDRKKALDNGLKQVEQQIFDNETAYLQETKNRGNVIQGFPNLATASFETPKNPLPVANEARLFSLSSVTAPTGSPEVVKKLMADVDAPIVNRKKPQK